jgi:hypothetical protein
MGKGLRVRINLQGNDLARELLAINIDSNSLSLCQGLRNFATNLGI